MKFLMNFGVWYYVVVIHCLTLRMKYIAKFAIVISAVTFFGALQTHDFGEFGVLSFAAEGGEKETRHLSHHSQI